MKTKRNKSRQARNLLARAVAFCLSLLVLGMGRMTTFAANADSVLPVVIDREEGTLTINYLEPFEEELPVSGAGFRAFRIGEFGVNGGYQSLVGIDINIDTKPTEALAAAKKSATDSYVMTTDANGKAAMPLPIGVYVLEEEKPAENHFASAPCIFTVPFMKKGAWDYAVYLEPKANPAGEILIEKTVTGTGGDREKEFHFKVSFNTEDEYDYTVTDAKGIKAKSGKVRNGDSIALKHGQKAAIVMIPAGTLYEVREQEANNDGYTTTEKRSKGTVPALSVANVAFENHKNAPTPTPTLTLTPSLTPIPSGNPTPTRPPYYPPQTGDESNMRVFVWIGAAAIAAIIIVLVRAGKNRRK